MFNRILIPLDNSRRAKAILPLVSAIAQAAYAEIILLSVAPNKAWFDPYIGANTEESDGVCETYLSRLERQLTDRSIRARHVLVRGEPASEIVQFAANNDVDLIAMATHGRSGVDRWSFGSVADEVMRTSTVPVLVSRAPVDDLERDVGLRQRILIPLDGSPQSEAVIPYALKFASLTNVQFMFLSVIDDAPETDRLLPAGSEKDDREYLAAAAEWQSPSQSAYLASVVERHMPGSIPTTHHVRFGPVARNILKVAGEEQVDLIAITTHARSGFSRFVAGSVATQVLQESRVPLLLVSGAAAKHRSEQCHSVPAQ